MAVTSDKILWDVMEEHLEEAGFLWTQWESALDAPDYTQDELTAREEQRLVAHLDALALGDAAVAEELLLPALELDEAETSVAAALVLMAGEHGAAVLDTLGAAEELTPGVWGLRRALELSAMDRVEQGLRSLATGDKSPLATAQALEALAFHGAHAGPLPASLLGIEEPPVMRSLLRAARVAPGDPPVALVERGLASEEAPLRDVALETGVLLGLEAAWARCTSLARQGAPGCRTAMGLTAALGGQAGREIVEPALEIDESRLDALWALGFCGSLEAAEVCVDALVGADDRVAAAAAEALSAITGLDLQTSGLVRAPEPRDSDDDDEGGLVLATAPEENLLVPDVNGVCAWWDQHRSDLAPDARQIMGRPPGLAALAQSLDLAPMWRRHTLALELSARAGGEALAVRLQTRTWCALQRRRVYELAQMDEQELHLDWGDR